MYVKDRMTVNPITIDKSVPISKALDIMATNHFHRLPVVDQNGALVGLVTEGIISENTPSKATSLSIYELNYLLSKTKCGDIMHTDIQTISPEALLEEAAVKMRAYNIGCLPVVEDNKVIGIITQNDIFAAFVDLLGYNVQGYRYVILVDEDKPGIMADACRCFSNKGISIRNSAVYHTSRGVEMVIISEVEEETMVDELKANGFNVTSVMKR